MLNPTKEYNKGRARLVPAGQESLNGYQTMAVTFEANAEVGSYLTTNPKGMEVRLPDRTVRVFTRTRTSNMLMTEAADIVVSTRRDLNQYKELGLDMMLFNPIHASSLLDTSAYKRNGIEVLVDSGGFQLIQGTSDFVDPKTTAEFYTKHATIGVGLDFPAPPAVDAVLYKENCNLQRRNNDLIREAIPSSVSLAPVVHGATVKTRAHCLDTVYNAKRDKSMCLSGMAYRPSDPATKFKNVLSSLAYVLHRTRKDVVYYHLLGATSNLMLALYALLSRSGYVTSIGGDSVSHRQSAIGGSYLLYNYFDRVPSFSQPKSSQVAASLPCACPVCAAVGDARMLRDFRLSELHHLYQSVNNNTAIYNTVGSYMAGKITRTQLWNFVVGSERGRQVAPNMMFDFFESIITKGYEKTKPLAPFDGFGAGSSLFGDSSVAGAPRELLDRYARIHKVYADYHGVKKL